MKNIDKKIIIFSFFVILFSIKINLAQTKKLAIKQTIAQNKLEDWNIHCDKLKGIPSGTENYPALIKAAKWGLKITPQNNFLYKSVFAFHLGGGYECTYQADSAIYYYEQSKKYAENVNNNSRIVFALRRLAGLYDSQQQPNQALKARNQLIAIAKTDKNEEIQIGVNIVLGEYYFNSGKYEEALKSYLNYIKYLKIDYTKTQNSASKSNIGVGYLAIGEIYQNLNRPAQSLPYFKEAITYLVNYQEGLETAYKDLVISYLTLKHVDTAYLYYKKLVHSVAKSKDITLLIDAQVELGKAFLVQNKLDKAAEILFEAQKNVRISKQNEDLYTIKMAIGNLFLKQGNSHKAISYFKDALPLALYFRNKVDIATIYYNLATAEKQNNLSDSAYSHIVLYAQYIDSIKSESVSKNIFEMEARFQNQVKQQTIGILNRKNQIKNLQLQQEKKMRWLLAGAVLLSLLALGLIYLNVKNKQKANLLLNIKNTQLDNINAQLSNANQTKAKLFSIISHDLRSPVSQLFSFLRLQQANPNFITEDAKLAHQKNLIHTATNLLATMEDLLLWSKSQMENFEVDIQKTHLISFFNETILPLQNQADAKRLTISVEEASTNYLKTDANLLTIVLRNLLQNAINHAYLDTKIYIKAGIDEHQKTSISISNKGECISADKIDELLNNINIKSKSSGYGLLIVKELLQKLNGTLHITSSTESTVMKIVFL
jgi:signal transduction histidine kinase